jgi:hypothetical protein
MSEGILDTAAPAVAAPPTDSSLVEPVGETVANAISDQQADVANKEFLGQLPEALREMPALKSVKGAADLATQFVNQQALLGNSLRIPTEDTGEEQRNEFYNRLTEVPGVVRLPGEDADESVQREFLSKLGVPATPQEYQIQLPEGQTLEDDYLQVATERAYELGLSSKQLNKVFQRELAEREQAAIDQANYVEQSVVQLKSIWGSDYENRVAGASNALRIYKDEMPEYAAELEAYANNPLVIKLLSDIGETMQEKGHAGMQAANNYGMTVSDAKMKKE